MDDLGTVQLTPELAELLVQGVDAELAGRDTAMLARRRDELLVDLLAGKNAAHDLP